MKTRFILLVLLIVCFSCGTNNKPVSDAQKEKIKGEVKEVVNTYFKGAEEANADMMIGTYLDSPDFVFTYNGNSFSYKSCTDLVKSAFGTLKNQKITVVDEKYAVLDNSTVMVTVNNKCLMNYKDGHSVLQDPWISQILLKKIENKWKVISGAESGIEQSVKNTETSKELNQIELMKKFIGTWKAEAGKDTSFIWEGKSYGEGLDVYVKTETKGKIVSEGKAVLAYDNNSDKYIQARIMKTSGSIIGEMWFTTKNTCEGVLLKDISNPENGQFKAIFEFISPTKLTQTYKVPNKPDVVSTFTLQNK
jgi:hypothetical protein